jgi:hypothetical protein
MSTSIEYKVPLIIRGRVIQGDAVSFGGRRGAVRFSTPDVRAHLNELVLTQPSALAELHSAPFEEVLDYLQELGKRLEFDQNAHLQEAFKLSCETSGLGPKILRHCYETLGSVFDRENTRDMADILIGIPFLDGWVTTRRTDGYEIAVRAFGARAVHIIAGNVPTMAALAVVRNTIVRSDAIIKSPSNDPLTAAAIVRTMVDMAPDHVITRHISVAYWKGGDGDIEDIVYQPANIEKIVSWGGLASIKHITKYIQPGIDLITLDPKLSSSIIGSEAFHDEERMRDAAMRLALDVGIYNQEGCVNARVVYIECCTDQHGIALANRFGEMVYEAIQSIPPHLSSPRAAIESDLALELEGLAFAADAYRLIGGDGLGAVIVSQYDEPVEFSHLLKNRVVNLVPVDDLEKPILSVSASTQTIGIYPDSLVPQLRDRLAFHGAQRLVSLGYASRRVIAGPSDGIELVRRMCKWIMHERYDAAVISPQS